MPTELVKSASSRMLRYFSLGINAVGAVLMVGSGHEAKATCATLSLKRRGGVWTLARARPFTRRRVRHSGLSVAAALRSMAGMD